jgi:hypothetical protein
MRVSRYDQSAPSAPFVLYSAFRAAQSQNQELLREKKDLSEIIQRKNNELDAKTVEFDQLLAKNRALTEANLEAKRTR